MGFGGSEMRLSGSGRSDSSFICHLNSFYFKGWSDDRVDKGIYCWYRGHKFNSQHLLKAAYNCLAPREEFDNSSLHEHS